MFEARSRGWFSSEYDIVGAEFQSVEIGKVNDYWRESHFLRVDNRRFKLSRKSFLGGEFAMHEDEELVAKASKKASFVNCFDFELSDTKFSLYKQIRFISHFELFENDKKPSVGTIIQNGYFSSSLIVDLPDEISAMHQLFITWLAIVLIHESQSS